MATRRLGATTVTFHHGGRTLVVNDVPANVGASCGEAYVADDVTAQLLQIATD